MAEMKRLCDSSAVSEAQLYRFSLGDIDIVVSRIEGKPVALEDRCGHMAAPLSMGKLEGCALVCPLHEAAFDMLTGKPLSEPRLPAPPPGEAPSPRQRMFALVRTYPVKVFAVAERDGGIFVELPAS